eukprot:6181430-Pleurochrysis_carterae.AAC.1
MAAAALLLSPLALLHTHAHVPAHFGSRLLAHSSTTLARSVNLAAAVHRTRTSSGTLLPVLGVVIWSCASGSYVRKHMGCAALSCDAARMPGTRMQ